MLSGNLSAPSLRQIWRLPTVQQYTGLSKSTIYQLIKDGKFPAAHKLGDESTRSVGWDSLEVQAWIDARLNGGAA